LDLTVIPKATKRFAEAIKVDAHLDENRISQSVLDRAIKMPYQ